MKTLALFLSLIMLPVNVGQMPMGGVTASGSVPCTQPSAAYLWNSYNGSNTYATGNYTTNGSKVATIPSYLTANTATGGGTSFDPIIDTATTLNGFNSWNLGLSFVSGATLATTIPASGSMTLWAVVNFNSYCLTNSCPILNASVTGHSPYWGIDNGKQELYNWGSASIGTATTTLTAGTWYVIAAQYNFTTGAYAFYNCSAGTCTADGSGTSVQTFALGANQLFKTKDFSALYKGNVLEVGYFNSTTTTGIATWTQCKYAI